MRRFLLTAVAAMTLGQAAMAQSPAADIAKIGGDFTVYQDLCGGVVPPAAWDYIMSSVKKYGADRQALIDEVMSKRADFKKDGPRFCTALTQSVNAMIQGLSAME